MYAKTHQILFVCSPSKTLYTFHEVLLARLHSPITAGTLQDAELIVARMPLSLIICASELIDGTYRDVLELVNRKRRKVPVLVVSLVASEKECEEARQLGAADCMARPLTLAEVQTVVDKAFEVIARSSGTA